MWGILFLSFIQQTNLFQAKWFWFQIISIKNEQKHRFTSLSEFSDESGFFPNRGFPARRMVEI